MLEKSADEMDVSYFSQIRKEAYYEGVMIGMCESWCRIYKTAKAEKDAKMMSYMSPDIVKELERFYNKYGNLSDDKMSRRILRESEYLMGVWRD